VKVLISADGEGISGITSSDELVKGKAEYERFRHLMTADVNAAIEGAAAGGATEIIVNDSHWGMNNILPEELDPRADLVRGFHKPLCMMHGVEEDIDTILCVGYHAKVGHSDGVANETMIGREMIEIRMNGRPVGELEIIRHSGASAVIPFLGDPGSNDPSILLIRQYRYAADGFIYEIPAGRLEPGEPPEECAVRELREETGCTAAKMEHLYTMYTTPGFTDEKIHLFVATGLVRGESALEADEFVEVVPMAMSAALMMIKDGTINDAKTALSILYVAGFFLGR